MANETNTTRKFQTDQAPRPIGPYSQAVHAGEYLFLSGQVPLDPATGEMVQGSIAAQTEQVFKNLEAVLSAAGARFEDVVKVTVFLKSMDDFAEMNGVYGQHFTDHRPARSCVEVSRLPADASVEIDLIAFRPGS